MKVHAMNHFTILAQDLGATRAFYTEILGLKEGYRPPFGFPGIWFYAGKHPILHVIGRDRLPDPKGGVFDHMAYSGRDLPAMLDKLKTRGIKHDLVKQTGSGIWQVFFYDPNGAKIEIDFAPEESPDPGARRTTTKMPAAKRKPSARARNGRKTARRRAARR